MKTNQERKATLVSLIDSNAFSVLVTDHKVRLDPDEYSAYSEKFRVSVGEYYKQLILDSGYGVTHEAFDPYVRGYVWMDNHPRYSIYFEGAEEPTEVHNKLEEVFKKRIAEFEEEGMVLVRVDHSTDLEEGTITLHYKKEG